MDYLVRSRTSKKEDWPNILVVTEVELLLVIIDAEMSFSGTKKEKEAAG